MRRSELVWIALAIVIVGGAMVAWEMREKITHAPASAQSSKPSPATQALPARAGVGAIVVGNGSTLVKLRPAEDPSQDMSYLSITLSGNGELLLQDPQAQRLGFDPQNHTLLRQIGNGSYDEGDMIDDDDDEAPNSPPPSPTPTPTPPATLSGLADNGFRRLEISRPAPGHYVLTVITRNEANYSLLFHLSKRNGNPSTADFEKVSVSPGETHVYDVEIPADASREIKAVRRQAVASH
jgi:hypothetical protein